MGGLSIQMTLAEAGMGIALSTRLGLVAQIRIHVQMIALARPDRTATADDVDTVLSAIRRTHAELGNAAGSIFRDGRWLCTGEWRSSERISNHARPIRVWQLK